MGVMALLPVTRSIVFGATNDVAVEAAMVVVLTAVVLFKSATDKMRTFASVVMSMSPGEVLEATKALLLLEETGGTGIGLAFPSNEFILREKKEQERGKKQTVY